MRDMWLTAVVPSNHAARVALAIPAICTAAAALLWTTPEPVHARQAPINLTRIVQTIAAPDTPAEAPADPPPRIAEPAACQPPACVAVFPPSDPFAPRSLPFTFTDLTYALDAAGWTDQAERDFLVRMIFTCENRDLNAGAVSYSGEAFGTAQVMLGWFDVAGIPRELWPSITANIRAAKAARDDAVSRGLPPFIYWSCRYAGAPPGT